MKITTSLELLIVIEVGVKFAKKRNKEEEVNIAEARGRDRNIGAVSLSYEITVSK